MPKDRVYTTKDLINTYIETQKPNHSDFINYYNHLLAALQKAFRVDITDGENVESRKKPLYMLFISSIRSLAAIQTPWSGFIDASLILKRLEEIGDVGDNIQRISASIVEITEQGKKLHWELVEELFNCLYNTNVALVTSQDLYTTGFDDAIEPNINDYEY